MSKREMTSTSKKQNGTITGERTGQVTKKSAKGNSHQSSSSHSGYDGNTISLNTFHKLSDALYRAYALLYFSFLRCLNFIPIR
jgi:hypothetical protein